MSRTRRKGVALLTALCVIVAMMGLMLGLFYIGLADSRQAIVNRGLIRATGYAEGATEVGQKAMLLAVTNQAPIPTGGTAVIGGVDVPYTITPVGPKRSGENANGLMEIGQIYSIAATGEYQGMRKNVEKLVDVTALPLFQFAIFYDEDLEIIPGPALNIYGRVHTNGNMYLGSGATLTFLTNYVRAAGHVYRRDKSTGLPTTGIVDIQVKDTAKTAKMESKQGLGVPSVSGFDSDFMGYDKNGDGDVLDKGDLNPWTQGALNKWNGTVKSVEHDVQTITPPSRDLVKMYVPSPDGTGGDYTYNEATGTYDLVAAGTGDYQKGTMFANAGLTLVDQHVYDGDGNEILAWPDVTGDGAPDNPISQSSIYDGREQKYVTVTNVDMEVLGKSGYWPDNGLLYAVRSDASAAQPNGIRLQNGTVLVDRLTVVTPNPVYIRGDYNEGDGTYPKVPASVMCDAFNILSNAWDDTKTPGSLPHAKPTTINCAFVTGLKESTLGQFSGGFENLPRFHEKWDGSPAEMRGSYVAIWDSETAQGNYAYGGDRFTGLSRDWNYDTMFNDPDNLPPFTPMIYFTRKVAWVSR
jgi:hypothetical protein